MWKKPLMTGLLFVFLMGGTVGIMQAQEATTTVEIEIEEEITLAELGIENPGTLPDSRWYFLKEWRRGVQKLFSFGAVKKAQTDLEFINERAAELKEMARRGAENVEAITEATERYRQNMEELKTRIENIRETSENPNIEELVDRIVDRAVKHQQLFDELKMKFEDHEAVKEGFEKSQEQFQEIVAEVPKKFEDAAAFAERLKKTVEEYSGGALPELRKIELVDRIGEKLTEDTKEHLGAYKEELKEQFEERLKGFKETDWNAVFAPDIFKQLPGDYAKRVQIIEEVKTRIIDPDISERIRVVQDVMVKDATLVDTVNPERIRQIMAEARALVERLEQNMANVGKDTRERMKHILEVAKEHMRNAEQALQNNQQGEAFGQAVAALAQAKNALSYFNEWRPKSETPTSSAGTPIACPAVYIASCERDKNSEQCKIEIDQLERKYPNCGFERLFNREDSNDNDRDDGDHGIVCTQEYAPVCGHDGKTYSNKCYAARAGVGVKYNGVCEKVIIPQPSTSLNDQNILLCGPPPEVVVSDGCVRICEEKQWKIKCEVQSPDTADTSTNTGLMAVIVSIAITDDGFVPQEVKIKKGTRVQWINRTSRLAWPASAVHPTHTEYPEKGSCTAIGGSAFDSCRGLQSGETWSFPFHHVGSWKYHDHLNPSLTGAIVVTE